MKINYKINESPELEILLSEKEKIFLKEFFEKKGFEISESKNIFGENICGKYYRKGEECEIKLLSYRNSVNHGIMFEEGTLNIGIFRVLDFLENGKSFKICKFLTSNDFKNICEKIAEGFKKMILYYREYSCNINIEFINFPQQEVKTVEDVLQQLETVGEVEI